MRLYHGTTARHLKSILYKGLWPRGPGGICAAGTDSRQDLVYLTSSHPFWFALRSCRQSEQALVVELDMAKLDTSLFLPDQSFVERAMTRSGKTGNFDSAQNGSESLELHRKLWTASLSEAGQVCFQNFISPKLITRYCLFDHEQRPALTDMVWTASPKAPLKSTAISHAQEMVSWMFGDSDQIPYADGAGESSDRDGISIVVLKSVRNKPASTSKRK